MLVPLNAENLLELRRLIYPTIAAYYDHANFGMEKAATLAVNLSKAINEALQIAFEYGEETKAEEIDCESKMEQKCEDCEDVARTEPDGP